METQGFPAPTRGRNARERTGARADRRPAAVSTATSASARGSWWAEVPMHWKVQVPSVGRNAYSGPTPMENAVRPGDGMMPSQGRNVKSVQTKCPPRRQGCCAATLAPRADRRRAAVSTAASRSAARRGFHRREQIGGAPRFPPPRVDRRRAAVSATPSWCRKVQLSLKHHLGGQRLPILNA